MITNITLTTKEKLLLQDAQSHEEQCILKYSNFEKLAMDTQLKAVFRANGAKEQEHLQTINQLLSGKVPDMGQSGGQSTGQSGGQSGHQSKGQSGTQGGGHSSGQSAQGKWTDKDLCIDLMNTEKYVSGFYDTAIFEFKDAQIRDVLNHIQKEEQKHGEALYKYMESKGMYSAS